MSDARSKIPPSRARIRPLVRRFGIPDDADPQKIEASRRNVERHPPQDPRQTSSSLEGPRAQSGAASSSNDSRHSSACAQSSSRMCSPKSFRLRSSVGHHRRASRRSSPRSSRSGSRRSVQGDDRGRVDRMPRRPVDVDHPDVLARTHRLEIRDGCPTVVVERRRGPARLRVDGGEGA